MTSFVVVLMCVKKILSCYEIKHSHSELGFIYPLCFDLKVLLYVIFFLCPMVACQICSRNYPKSLLLLAFWFSSM